MCCSQTGGLWSTTKPDIKLVFTSATSGGKYITQACFLKGHILELQSISGQAGIQDEFSLNTSIEHIHSTLHDTNKQLVDYYSLQEN